jgi:hypothetical protein
MQLTNRDMRARQHEGSCVVLTAATQRVQRYYGRESCKHGQETARSAAQSTQELKRHSRTVAVPRHNIADNQRSEVRTSAAPASKNAFWKICQQRVRQNSIAQQAKRETQGRPPENKLNMLTRSPSAGYRPSKSRPKLHRVHLAELFCQLAYHNDLR